MKKYLAVFIMILICLLLPMQIRASQSEIGTTVPETHTVSIEAEHASAQYMEGDKGISDAYPVPRFSKPEFKITVEDGYEVKRVLLNDNDVTKNVENGSLKLSEVCENQVIRIETEAVAPEDAEPSQKPQNTQKPQSTQKPQTSQKPQTQQSQVPQTSQAAKTSQAPEKQNTVKNAEQIQETTETGDQEQQDTTETTGQAQESGKEMSESISQGEMDGANTENEPEVSARHFSFWWILLLLLTVGIIIWLIIVLKKRKNSKNEGKSLNQ